MKPVKTIEVKEYQATDISLFRNDDGTFGISAIVRPVLDEIEKELTDKEGNVTTIFKKLPGSRERVNLDASDTAALEELLTKFLTKATEDGVV